MPVLSGRTRRARQPGRSSRRVLAAAAACGLTLAAACGTATGTAGTAGTAGPGTAIARTSPAPDGDPAAVGLAPRTSDGAGPGYALVTAAGVVGTFGGAGFRGDLAGRPPPSPVVGMAATGDGRGYWLLQRSGAVAAFGDARSAAAPPPPPGAGTAVALVPVPGAVGYRVVYAGGQVSSVGAEALGPVAVPAADGPVVGAVPAGADALWLATASGAVLAAGHPPVAVTAPAPGSLPGPVVAIAGTPGGRGYWLADAAGRVVAVGDAAAVAPKTTASGDTGGQGSLVALVAAPGGGGFLAVYAGGAVAAAGRAVDLGDGRSPLHPPLYPSAFQSAPTNAVGGAYLAPGPQVATTGPTRVTVLGDSLSVILGRYLRRYVAVKGVSALVSVGGIMGCGVVGDLPLATYSDPSPPAPTLPACGQWRQQYAQALAWSHPDVVVVLLGYWESQRHAFDGRTVTLATSAPYRSLVAGSLATVAAMARGAGARLVLLGSPLFGDGTPAANVAAFNTLLGATTRAAGATELPLRPLLDPGGRFAMTVDGVPARTSDRVHLTRAGVDRIIAPVLMPLLLRVGGRPR